MGLTVEMRRAGPGFSAGAQVARLLGALWWGQHQSRQVPPRCLWRAGLWWLPHADRLSRRWGTRLQQREEALIG